MFLRTTMTELNGENFHTKNVKCYSKDNKNFFVIGAGSNLLVSENIQKRIFIKLGKNFNKISLTKDNIIIAGCSIIDKNISDFAGSFS